MTDYQAVQKTLAGGGDPALLCATCPWDRNCITPPSMTSAEVDARIAEIAAKDDARMASAMQAGTDPGMPAATLLGALMFAGRDQMAGICPVLALRLRTSGGRKIAETLKNTMQGWDDEK